MIRFVLHLFAAISIFSVAAFSSADCYSLRFHIAQDDGKNVVSSSWIAERVAKANEIFAESHLSFDSASEKPSSIRSDIVSRWHRHQLAKSFVDDDINVFVVNSLTDVDIAGRALRGVHWRTQKGKVRYIILSKIAGKTVLAHELGHFFGNAHLWVDGNIMSYSVAKKPYFTEKQRRKNRRQSKKIRMQFAMCERKN